MAAAEAAFLPVVVPCADKLSSVCKSSRHVKGRLRHSAKRSLPSRRHERLRSSSGNRQKLK